MSERATYKLLKTENLVVGTGFVALQAVESLQTGGREVLCIDASQAIKPGKVVSKHPEYDPESLVRTAVPGGGAWFWGGKVTLPSAMNWFRPSAHMPEGWKDFGHWATLGRTNRGIFEKALSGRPRPTSLKQNASKLKPEAFIIDTHLHLRGKRRVNIKVRDLGKTSIRATHGLHVTKTRSGWVVRFESDCGGNIEVLAKRIFLASGAIGNMLLLSRITGERKFPLGNHAGATAGKMVLKSRLPLRNFGALVPWGQFQSWSNSSKTRFNHSFRIAPISTLPKGLQQSLRSLLALKPLKSTRQLFEVIATYLLQRPKESSIYAMLDTGLHAQAFVLDWPAEDEDCTELRITVNSREYLETGKSDFQSLKSDLAVLRLGVIEDFQGVEYGDTHHYFGTCPMSEPIHSFLSVDENFQVRGYEGLFCLGSASFPEGSHGHPTLLAVLTAKYAVEKALRDESR